MVRARPVHLTVLPATRAECALGERPCPYVSCRHHLLVNVAEDGRLFISRDLDEDDADSIAEALVEMPETCSLDVARRGEHTFEAVAQIMGIKDRQTVEQVQFRALARVRDSGVEFDEREHPDDPYLRYTDLGAEELAEVAGLLKARQKERP